MMSAKHTPGPWRENGCVIEGPKMGLQIAQIQYRAVGSNTGFAAQTKAEAFANARLIAAAPDLLAALQLHQAWSDSENAGPDYGGMTRDTHPEGEIIWRKWWNANCDLCERAQDATRAAIAAATGANHER